MHRTALASLAACAVAFAPARALAAAPGCDAGAAPHVLTERKRELGPAHHPLGRALPTSDSFNAPDRCLDGVWFFDLNANGMADPAEPRVFGPGRVVDCDSCHGDSDAPKSAQSASVFLRQDASRLCVVCHRM